MSKNTLVKELKKEITRLNIIIDLKIIRGLPYKKESLRHKFLVSQLHSLARPTHSWFQHFFYERV